MRRVLVINGPNLNLLGEREPEVYGRDTLADLEDRVTAWGGKLGFDVTTFQSNHEGAIIDRLHAARTDADGLVVNLGAFTHYSYALHDAIVATDLPAVEVHISNVMRREPWRTVSVTAPACIYAIYGRGLVGYRDALRLLKIRTASPVHTTAYGDGIDQVVDIRTPPGPGPHPIAAFLHGGFWRSEWTRDTIDGLAADMHRRGWLTANVEYRRLDVGGGWPQTLDDVIAAIRGVTDLAGADASRLSLIGHSAGGHLALLAAPEVGAGAVVGLAAITDPAAAYAAGIGDDSVARFMGGTPEALPERYSTATPQPAGSVLLVHGADDHLVPPTQSSTFAAKHPGVQLLESAETGHFELLDPERDPWQRVVDHLTT
jgi:3-dehydroquinate dehydratase-2